ncbi:hypothetical protein CONCODRAFT_4249 [Conidiobolus coronatus NRRL 28638]|uniref:DUF6787 domain-containing protein n=1 Tax=Conidiobolus coronatus (strain ATCC 28846 / CBS 209.66 / NRRL 28638) TaxID=796925 RepID=A0A137PCX6_CONC2|nr:hypothetical protein CONCODRAFT_4249 [Conidiobolus coronatus NRRL 28638]|eukprot:KXN72854.1 hypothetical protein CONCODRAFT_4249 [Conidiobolus coronatus NRRL 28638]
MNLLNQSRVLYNKTHLFNITKNIHFKNIHLYPTKSVTQASTHASPSTHVKFTKLWWKDILTIGTVFSITGTSCLLTVKPLLNQLGVYGSMKEGPWSYRVTRLSVSVPYWCATLTVLGTAFGKGQFFKSVAKKVISRFIPKKLVKPSQQKSIPRSLQYH